MIAADRVLDRPRHVPSADRDEPELERHAQHHDVDELFAAESFARRCRTGFG